MYSIYFYNVMNRFNYMLDDAITHQHRNKKCINNLFAETLQNSVANLRI